MSGTPGRKTPTTLLSLPEDILLYVLRHAAADEETFHVTATERAAVCKPFRAAAAALLVQHDAAAEWLHIPGDKMKKTRWECAAAWSRTEQMRSTDPILLAELRSAEESSASEALAKGDGDRLNPPARLLAFVETLFDMAWQGELSRSGPSDTCDPQIAANLNAVQAMQWRPPEGSRACGFRMHLRRQAAHALATLFEADAMRLLVASRQAAEHRSLSCPDPPDERSELQCARVEVGARDVQLAVRMSGNEIDGQRNDHSLPLNGTPQHGGYSWLEQRHEDQTAQLKKTAEIRRMLTLLPEETARRIVLRLAKRAGILRHTVPMVNAVWFELGRRLAARLLAAGHVLHCIAMSQVDDDEESDERDSDEESVYHEEEEEEESEEEDGDEEDGNKDDARWDDTHSEWVLLPSSEILARFYGVSLYGCKFRDATDA